jgi:hypothetical protein
MRILHSNIVSTCAVVVAMGLICSQLCALNCALGSCIFSTKQTQAAHHCHHHDQSSQNNQKQSDQKDCHSNADVIAALPDGTPHISIEGQFNQALAATVVSFVFNSARENPRIGLPFKSPPTTRSVSVLRI